MESEATPSVRDLHKMYKYIGGNFTKQSKRVIQKLPSAGFSVRFLTVLQILHACP